MSRIGDALAEAGRLRAGFVGETGYALAYGSHAVHATGGDSDLDLLFVGPELAAERLARLVDAVIALHRDHRLRLDTEVSFEVKLSASLDEADSALALHGFDIGGDGALCVPPVVVQPWFLNSAPFKLRLVLNALTTTHVFLGGNINVYESHRVRAERAVALVALSLLPDRFTATDAAAILATGPSGAAGEDFLGYTDGPHLYSTIRRGLARLLDTDVLSCTDGDRFRQHAAHRRALVACLHAM